MCIMCAADEKGDIVLRPWSGEDEKLVTIRTIVHVLKSRKSARYEPPNSRGVIKTCTFEEAKAMLPEHGLAMLRMMSTPLWKDLLTPAEVREFMPREIWRKRVDELQSERTAVQARLDATLALWPS